MLLGARGLTVKAKGLDCGYVLFKGGYNTNVAGRQHPLIFISVMTRPRSHGSDVRWWACSAVWFIYLFHSKHATVGLYADAENISRQI